MQARAPKIVHFLYEPGDGGLDRVAILLANEMAAQGHDCELWMARADGPVAHLISDKVPVRIIAAPRIGGRGLRLLLQIPALARQIARSNPAVVFSAGNQSNLTIALARSMARSLARFLARALPRSASGRNATAIIQKITNPVERPGMRPLRRFVRRLRFGATARLADLVLTLSDADARALAALYPGLADRFVSVKNAYVTPAMLGIGTSRAPAQRSGPPRLLAAGRISLQKDYDTLLRALALIAHRPWAMTVLGDGPLSSPIRALAQQLGIAERIDFKGFVADPVPFYASTDILVLSSRWEGFPAVPLEAMAAGCDIVATDCSPGLTEILAEADRHPVPLGDPKALARAIEQAIDRPHRSASLRGIADEYSLSMAATDHLRIVAPFLS